MSEQAFLDAIAQRPDDDAPRLVFADWLEDRGDPRADLIRAQCALTRQGGSDAALQVRVRRLVDPCAAAWLEPLRQFGVRAVRLVRGLPEYIDVDVREEPLPEELIARTPTVRTLRMHVGDQWFMPLRILLEHATWPLLSELDLTGCPLVAGDLRHLAQWDRAWQLRRLTLAESRLQTESIFVLAAGEPFANLESLDLSRNNLTDHDLEALTCGTRDRQLAELRFDGNAASDEGLVRLLSSPVMARLRVLSMAENQLQFGRVWSTAVPLPVLNLRTVNLSRNPLANAGHARIGDSSAFARVKTLILQECGLTGRDMLTLVPLRVLARLNLDVNPIDDFGVRILANQKNSRLLRELSLRRTRIGDVAADRLAASPHLAELQRLRLEGNTFSPPAVRALQSRFGERVRL